MAPAKTPKPQLSHRERKKRETRQRILKAALALMATCSYDDVKVEEICEAAERPKLVEEYQ